MKAKRAIVAAVAAVFAGITAFALTGCEWFSFDRNKAQDVPETLGYTGNTAAWLTSKASSPRSDALQLYEDAKKSGAIASNVTFLDFLKAINDDSASLTAPLRSSVAIRTPGGAGSGVVYKLKTIGSTTSAYIITNYHVTYGARTFNTTFYGETSSSALSATYVGGSESEDIAVLLVDITGKTNFVLPISRESEDSDKFDPRDSDDVKVGEKVYAIGNLLGNGISVVSGIVSVQAEYNTFAKISDSTRSNEMLTMRIDAPVAHGNSGGGLFDGDGRLVGIVNGGMENAKNGDDTIDVDNYGFAIPANRAISVAQNVIDKFEEKGSDKAVVAVRARLGAWHVDSSEGKYDDDTESVDIVERVSITSVDSQCPFSEEEILGKTLTQIIVKDASGGLVVNKMITREHQIKSVLYNVRSGFTVELHFAEGDPIAKTYSSANNNYNFENA
ncbi:MAG: S1C family serine protease [Clostridia bacterium]|nr:S1C family serine protease [Clostridia bacterium]